MALGFDALSENPLSGIAVVAGGPVSYSDLLSAGTYSISGISISDSIVRADSLAKGTYTLTGIAISDKVVRGDSLSVGSYTFSGKTISDSVVRGDSLSNGVYTISGKTVSDSVVRGDLLSTGSYIVTGFNVNDVITTTGGTSYTDLLSVGSYSLTGNNLTDSYVLYIQEGLGGGSGYPVYGKYKRPKGISEFLDIAMQDIYAEGTKKTAPKELKAKIVKIVKPYKKENSIDWNAFEKDTIRVQEMIDLWNKQIMEEDELIISAYMQFYH